METPFHVLNSTLDMTKQRDIELENILIETFTLKCESKKTDRKGAEKNVQEVQDCSKRSSMHKYNIRYRKNEQM